MDGHIYDLIIIGAGPAGMTAAVYAARKKIDFIIISEDLGGQAAWSGDIENYTGYQFITGPELTLKFHDHINSFGIEVKMPESVTDIKREKNLVTVLTKQGQYRSKTVIVASGKKPRKLNIPGEEEFRNKGLTYCATCDGPLFKDKEVVVVGGGNSALDAVLQLMSICKHVHLMCRGPSLIADQVMIEKAKLSDKVTIRFNSELTKIEGDTFISSVSYKQQDQMHDLAVQGVFVEIGLMPNTDFAKNLKLNEKKEIIIDSHCKTSLEAVFAAGDVTDVPEKQIIIACGEGSKACLASFSYLSTHNF